MKQRKTGAIAQFTRCSLDRSFSRLRLSKTGEVVIVSEFLMRADSGQARLPAEREFKSVMDGRPPPLA